MKRSVYLTLNPVYTMGRSLPLATSHLTSGPRSTEKTSTNTKHQRCRVHKTCIIVGTLPKGSYAKAKGLLKDIYLAETRKAAENVLGHFCEVFEAKHPKIVECLVKDREVLLAFYNFPAEYWVHIRTCESHRIAVCNHTPSYRTHKGSWLSQGGANDCFQARPMR